MSVTRHHIYPPRGADIEAGLDERIEGITGKLSASLPTLPLSFTFRIEKIDVLKWLKQIKGSPRLYWASRNGKLEIGGYGVAMAVVARDASKIVGKLDEIEKILRACGDAPFLRFVGGRCFETVSTNDPLWAEFPPLWFGIPQLSITRTGTDCYLTVAASVTPDTTPASLLEEIYEVLNGVSLSAVTSNEESLEILSRQDRPDRVGWVANVEHSLREIQHRNVEKVVLARRTDLAFSRVADPFSLLSKLKRRNRNCFAFLFEPQAGKAFLGVTPERLFKVVGGHLVSEAISGTIGCERDPRDGQIWRSSALYTEKNLLEHQYVLDDITNKIEKLCDRIQTSRERSTFSLTNLSHIYSRISGRLRADVSIGQIISTLHPTPAVGGTPRERALPLVRELEPFVRGWYASPVGIIGQHHVEMAVAIRSAVVAADRAALFAGAGIVSGSSPDAEWRELEHKISHAIEGLSGVLL